MHLVYIGIGSNLANPLQQINVAIDALKRLSDDGKVICSPLYQTHPMVDETPGTTAYSAEQPDYINGVVKINSSLEPLQLLDKLQEIEQAQGRKRTHERWTARTLDLDVLLFDNDIIDHPRLTVPHYGIKQRNFVIYPLTDLDDNLVLPDGTTIKDLYQRCSSKGINKIV